MGVENQLQPFSVTFDLASVCLLIRALQGSHLHLAVSALAYFPIAVFHISRLPFSNLTRFTYYINQLIAPY